MTAMAPRSNREKLFSADQPSRIASSALAAPALPGRYLLDGSLELTVYASCNIKKSVKVVCFGYGMESFTAS